MRGRPAMTFVFNSSFGTCDFFRRLLDYLYPLSISHTFINLPKSYKYMYSIPSVVCADPVSGYCELQNRMNREAGESQNEIGEAS